MACSTYEYVRQYEKTNSILRDTWMIVRIDGRGFSKFSSTHGFQKPSDDRSLFLMNSCARRVMIEYADIVLAYGHSDEYSFLFKKDSTVWNRREEKLISTIASLFSSSFVFYWKKYFEDIDLKYPPTFDARVVCYPTKKSVKDYFSWRQVDCHVNNQYNYCFWSLVEKNGKSHTEAYNFLKGTTTAVKNDLLFLTFGINYNTLPQLHRKGSTLIREQLNADKKNTKDRESSNQKLCDDTKIHKITFTDSVELAVPNENTLFINETLCDNQMDHSMNEKIRKTKKSSKKWEIKILHDDIISNVFWENYPHILGRNCTLCE